MNNSFNDFDPLEKRVFKLKNPSLHFFCPLCRTERSLPTRPSLSKLNFIQIAMATVMTTLIFYPIAEWRFVFSGFFYLAVFEFYIRSKFKKDLPCPHCGFDATWYKKDVKMARAKVKEFWDKKGIPTSANIRSS